MRRASLGRAAAPLAASPPAGRSGVGGEGAPGPRVWAGLRAACVLGYSQACLLT